MMSNLTEQLTADSHSEMEADTTIRSFPMYWAIVDRRLREDVKAAIAVAACLKDENAKLRKEAEGLRKVVDVVRSWDCDTPNCEICNALRELDEVEKGYGDDT
jgi:hypothetical protein